MSELSSGWATAPLGEVVEILDSIRVPINAKEREHRSGDVPYFGATGQVGWIDEYLFDQEIVLLGEDGAPFLDMSKPKAYLVNGKSWVNNHAHVLIGKPGLSNRFLMYQLNTIDFREFVSGTTRLKLPQGPMRQISLSVAPAKEQDRIVDEIEKQFTRLDAATAALKRVQANLKRYRASVLKAACEGRLVPTEAELARKEGRDYEPAEKLLQRILRERRARWESDSLAKMQASGKPPKDDHWKQKYKEPSAPDTSDLSTLPEGWAWASLEAVASVIDPNPSHRMPMYVGENGIPFISSENFIGENGIDFTTGKQVSVETLKGQVERFDLEHGAFALSRIGTIGKTRKLPVERTYCLSHALVVIQSTCRDIDSNFLRVVCSSSALTAIARDRVQSVGVPDLGMAKIRSFPVPVVPPCEQGRILAEVSRRISIVDELEATVKTALARASSLRRAILDYAFTGQLVPQDPTDEPASVLIERIRAERGASSKQRTARRSRKEPANA
jgi:type I restriction enzyme S subunit